MSAPVVVYTGTSIPCVPTPADKLRADRAATAEQTRALRLRRAVEALEACGFRHRHGDSLLSYARAGNAIGLNYALTAARLEVAALRASLADGSDEPRYAACGVALEALGALWAVSQ